MYLIDDAQIISLYQEGYSQDDIVNQYEIPAWYTRRVLKKAGFKTDNFRCLDDYIVNIVILLIQNGMLFQDIVDVCDISYYTIRDIVRKNNLQYISKKVRNDSSDIEIDSAFNKSVKFLREYNSGKSFCCVCRDLALSDKEILSAFHLIKCSDLTKHRNRLNSIILTALEEKYSITSVARKHMISISVVRSAMERNKL